MSEVDVVKIGNIAIVHFRGFTFIVKNGELKHLFGKIEEEINKHKDYIISKVNEQSG